MLFKFSNFTLVVVAGLLFLAQSSHAQIVFEDGGINVVDSALTEYIIVRDNADGSPTIVMTETGQKFLVLTLMTKTPALWLKVAR